MAYFDTTWYCNAGDQSTTGHYAVTKWATGTTIAAGALRRQNAAPTVGNERVFVCIVAGTTHATTEPTWVITRGGKTTDNTVTWQECTGASAVNGDLTNTPTWSQARAINTAATLGAIIQRNNGASYWICSTAGSVGASEPAWPNNTAGTTQADGTVTWTCLGVVGSFTGGQAPHARLENACLANWFAVGNTVYVGDNHAESKASSITIAPALGNPSIGRILCHNHSGSYPPASSDLTTGATISATGASNVTMSPTGGALYVYGLTLKSGVGSSGAATIAVGTGANSWIYCDCCSFQQASTGGNLPLSIGAAASNVSIVTFNNCTVSFGAVSHYVLISGAASFTWQNTGQVLASGSSVPNSFLQPNINGLGHNITLEALDLSQLTGNLWNPNTFYEACNITIKDCKLNASAIVQTPVFFGANIQTVRSDSSGTGYKSARYQYEGTETTETSITRVGGASDPTGQAQSRKIVTATSQWLRPFKAEPYAIWNPTTGANVTVTVCGTVNAGALPNNDDIWLEVEYLGSSASSLGTIVTTTKSNVLAAGSAAASDGSTWNTPHTTFDAIPVAGSVVSNGGLTVTHTSGSNNSGANSTAFVSGGKYYMEFTIGSHTGAGGGMVGVNLSTSDYSNPGLNVGCTGVFTTTVGTIVSNNAASSYSLGSFNNGDIVGVALDFNGKLGWFRRNNGLWNGDVSANPTTGVNGVVIGPGSFAPFVRFNSTCAVTDNATANFGQSAYSGTVPSGFLSWDTSWTPFKLTTTLSAPQPGQAGYLEARVRATKSSATYYLDPKIVLS